MRQGRFACVLVVGIVVALGGCKKKVDDGEAPARARADAEVAAAPVELVIAYGSEKKTWLEEEIAAFNAATPRVHVTGKPMGSGEAVAAILDGTEKPQVFSPASGAYVALLNEEWMSRDGHTRPLVAGGEPLVLSPIVIAMWKPMAEALGWPDKPIGWADILKVSRSAKGWGGLGRPEWGSFKLGHTHPEFSNSGLLTVLAIAYAGAGKTRGLEAADLRGAKTRAFVEQVEDAVVHYGKSTGFFAEKMVGRGPEYLSAAVLYENLVIESYGRTGTGGPPVVAVYPVEGTFWSDHPYAVLDGDWVSGPQREAAAAFLAFLKARPAQERALALGFRPADPAVAIGAPIDAAHGVDPLQPQTLLEIPDAPTLAALLALWRETKKPSDVVLVFDKSGSMKGDPLAQAKQGGRAFLDSLDARDQATLIFFDGRVYPAVGPVSIEKGRADLIARIDGVTADGGTALHDAVLAAYRELAQRARRSPHRIHALVVMTDGKDEHSKARFDAVLKAVGGEESTIHVFTIGYGPGASEQVLSRIAEEAKGSYAHGEVATITEVFRDMASFF